MLNSTDLIEESLFQKGIKLKVREFQLEQLDFKSGQCAKEYLKINKALLRKDKTLI